MQSLLPMIIIGLIAGVAVGIQSPLASMIGARLGLLESVFIVHLGGTILAGIPLLLARGGQLGSWQHVPWYALGAGLLGGVVVGSVSLTIPRLGVATTVMLIVLGQLTIGVLADHYGLLGAAVRPIDAIRLVGIGLLLLGAWLVSR